MGQNLNNQRVMTRSELSSIKSYVIGVLILRSTKDVELVVKENGDYLDTIAFTPYAAMQESYNVPKTFGTFKRFPDKKNMTQMLEDPLVWQKFIKDLEYENGNMG